MGEKTELETYRSGEKRCNWRTVGMKKRPAHMIKRRVDMKRNRGKKRALLGGKTHLETCIYVEKDVTGEG